MLIKPPVPAEEVSSPDDRFRCAPYKSVLTVRACLSRQEIAQLPSDERREDYVYCAGCSLGATVRARTVIPTEDLLKKRPMRRKGVKKPPHRPNPEIAPSHATRAAIASLPAGLPKKPPAALARPAPLPPAPPPDPFADARAKLLFIEQRIGSVATRTGQLLAAARSLRARLAARFG